MASYTVIPRERASFAGQQAVRPEGRGKNLKPPPAGPGKIWDSGEERRISFCKIRLHLHNNETVERREDRFGLLLPSAPGQPERYFSAPVRAFRSREERSEYSAAKEGAVGSRPVSAGEGGRDKNRMVRWEAVASENSASLNYLDSGTKCGREAFAKRESRGMRLSVSPSV